MSKQCPHIPNYDSEHHGDYDSYRGLFKNLELEEEGRVEISKGHR